MAGGIRKLVARVRQPRASGLIRKIGKGGEMDHTMLQQIARMRPTERTKFIMGISMHAEAMSAYLRLVEGQQPGRKAVALREFPGEAIVALCRNSGLQRRFFNLLNVMEPKQLDPIFKQLAGAEGGKRLGRKYLKERKRSGYGITDDIEWRIEWKDVFSAR